MGKHGNIAQTSGRTGATAAAMGTHFFGGPRGGLRSWRGSEAAGLARWAVGVIEPAGRCLARAEVGALIPGRGMAYRTSPRARIYKATTVTSLATAVMAVAP